MKYLCRKCKKKHSASDNANRFSSCTCSCGNKFRLFAADFRCFDFTTIKVLSNFLFPYPQSYCPYCSGLVNVGTTSNLLSDGSMHVPEICPFCHNALRALWQKDEQAQANDVITDLSGDVEAETQDLIRTLKNMCPQERIDFFKLCSDDPEIDLRDVVLEYSKGGIDFTPEEWTIFEKLGWIQFEDLPKKFARKRQMDEEAHEKKEIDEKNAEESAKDILMATLKMSSPQGRIDCFKNLSEHPEINLRNDILRYSKGVNFTPEEWTIFEKRGWIQWEDLPKELAESLAED